MKSASYFRAQPTLFSVPTLCEADGTVQNTASSILSPL